MKKTFFVAVFAALAFAAPLFAKWWTDPATGIDWQYFISSGEVTIGRHFNVSGSRIIPSEINGVRVTAIWEWAFYNCSDLTSVTIPDSVTEIDPGAFSGCTGLTSVTIPASVTEIGREVFAGCPNLRTAYILNESCKIHPTAFRGSPTEIILGPRLVGLPLSWVYVAVAILVVVGGLLGIWWWCRRKGR